jgi:hypothetical protein
MIPRLVGLRLLLERARLVLEPWKEEGEAQFLLHDIRNVIGGIVLLEALEDGVEEHIGNVLVVGRQLLERVRLYTDARRIRFLTIDSPTSADGYERNDTAIMSAEVLQEALSQMDTERPPPEQR